MKTALSIFSLLSACGPTPLDTHQGHGGDVAVSGVTAAEFSPGGRVSLHGQIVFGHEAGRVFTSHIPMAHAAHGVQAIFAVATAQSPAPCPRPTRVCGVYIDNSAALADGMSFRPAAPSSLDDLVLGIETEQQGTVFDGNFEASPTPAIVEGFALGGVQAVYARALPVGGERQNPYYREPGFHYLVFGGRYLVHALEDPHDFDQIVRLDTTLDAPDGTVVDVGRYVPLFVGDTVTWNGQTAGIDAEVSLLHGPTFSP